jgi:hypothetical protein
MTTKAKSPVIGRETEQKEDHFRRKNEWKREPGNHLLPGEPTLWMGLNSSQTVRD